MEDVKGLENSAFLCDLCTRSISWNALVRIPIKDLQQAVRDGFNPFEAPGIDMPSPEVLFPGHNPTLEEMYEIWCERVMIDTMMDHWYVCPDCARAFIRSTKHPSSSKEASQEEDVQYREPRREQPVGVASSSKPKESPELDEKGENGLELVSIFIFVLATAWVGSMVAFSVNSNNFLWLVTILGAACMGAGAVYFAAMTFSMLHQTEDAGSVPPPPPQSPKKQGRAGHIYHLVESQEASTGQNISYKGDAE